MRILVLGSGAREHALAWKLSQEANISHVVCAPGNAGIARAFATTPVDLSDTDAVIRLVDREQIDLTVVGPEAPLGNGLADRFEAEGRRIFGPTRGAAQLETSKAFAKDFSATAFRLPVIACALPQPMPWRRFDPANSAMRSS
jgi:phosphoribosylamine---glycine ligase